MSHTLKTKVEFSDKTVLALAIAAMGGTVLGQGSHRLYAGNETGFGFKLPNWHYPLVLSGNGELRFDDFNGRWGNRADLDKLKGAYTIQMARQVAENQGWTSEMVGDNLVIAHAGGTWTVTPSGVIDANGFVGSVCELGTIIAEALGQTIEDTVKPEAYAEKVSLRRG